MQGRLNVTMALAIIMCNAFINAGLPEFTSSYADWTQVLIYLVSMPSYRTNQIDKDGRAIYQDICYPVTKEFREELYSNILSKYKETMNKKVAKKEPETNKLDETKKNSKKVIR